MKQAKAIGALALAAMALCAGLGVSPASASTSGSFTATSGGGGKFETTAIKQQIFTLTGSEIKCNKVGFSGIPGAETTSLILTPSYGECTAFGLPADVNNNGCSITLSATTDKANGHATAAIAGPICQNITIWAHSLFGECHVEVKPQTASGIHYSNNVSPEDITVQFTATSLTAHVTQSSGVCPVTKGTHTNASWTGEETVQVTGGLQFMEMASAGAP